MNQIYTEEEFNKLLDCLMGVTNEYAQWSPTKANKEHDDFWGDTIKRGEIYYKRCYGRTYDDIIKLSERSMDKLLFAIFAGNPDLKILGEHINKERFERLHQAGSKLKFPMGKEDKETF